MYDLTVLVEVWTASSPTMYVRCHRDVSIQTRHI